MARFKFYCDESHDSTNQKRRPGDPQFEPKSYIVSGFFADATTWSKIEHEWRRRNRMEGVPRFHAAHLNAATYEYEGWSKQRRIIYSKEILRVLKAQHNKLHGFSVGMNIDDYRRIISPFGQTKMGSPHMSCFKSVIATVAEQMDYASFPREERFDAIIDRSENESEAIQAFNYMKDNPKFKHGHRLGDCTSGSAEDVIGLQPADFVAYETFRLMHGKRNGAKEMRKALNTMLGTTRFLGYLFGEVSLNRIKDEVDSFQCEPNGMVIVPPFID